MLHSDDAWYILNPSSVYLWFPPPNQNLSLSAVAVSYQKFLVFSIVEHLHLIFKSSVSLQGYDMLDSPFAVITLSYSTSLSRNSIGTPFIASLFALNALHVIVNNLLFISNSVVKSNDWTLYIIDWLLTQLLAYARTYIGFVSLNI